MKAASYAMTVDSLLTMNVTLSLALLVYSVISGVVKVTEIVDSKFGKRQYNRGKHVDGYGMHSFYSSFRG